MPNSAVFEFVAGELERTTRLGRIAARGALRSALAQALFYPDRVTASQLRSVIERLLAPEIRRGGVEDADQVCGQLVARLASEHFEASGPESPDEIFSRLIRR
jgi:hypothetical protein